MHGGIIDKEEVVTNRGTEELIDDDDINVQLDSKQAKKQLLGSELQ